MVSSAVDRVQEVNPGQSEYEVNKYVKFENKAMPILRWQSNNLIQLFERLVLCEGILRCM